VLPKDKYESASFQVSAGRRRPATVTAVFDKMASRYRHPRTAEDIVLFAFEPGIDDAGIERVVLAADNDELKRMLLAVIPDRACLLVVLATPSLAENIDRLRNLFDLAFCLSDEKVKRSVARRFVEALDDEDESALVIETALFRAKYLQYLERDACKRMLRHVLARLQNEMSRPALQLVDGLEEFVVDTDDILAWLRTLVIACLAAPGDSGTEIRDYARRAYGRFPAKQKRAIVEKQEAVFQDCERDGNPELGHMLRRLQEDWSVPSADSTQAQVVVRIAKATTGR
jgi:hypothetical protein